jgi:DNA adenine methylase
LVYKLKLKNELKYINIQMAHVQKPILKWVGGKTQIIDKLIAEFPKDINNYREIFLGGGSVLLALLSYVRAGLIRVSGNIYASDINEPLIYVYKNIQTRHTELYQELQNLIAEFNSCRSVVSVNRRPSSIEVATESKENYYYWIRAKYNSIDKKTILGSAMFIFLNKTCFRGVFRMGPNGFNVPFGHYKNPEIINLEHINDVHELIQNVKFSCAGFQESLSAVEPNDFVYLDPPYAPETKSSFVSYTADGFNNHAELFALIHSLTAANVKIQMSNSDVSLVTDNFTHGYNKIVVLCKRSINSKKPESKVNEVIIKNYAIHQ